MVFREYEDYINKVVTEFQNVQETYSTLMIQKAIKNLKKRLENPLKKIAEQEELTLKEY